jgi:hypothetical protein
MSARPTFVSGQVLSAGSANILSEAIIAVTATSLPVTLGTADAGKLLVFSNSGTVTIPASTMSVGDQVNVVSTASSGGTVTFGTAAGVTLVSSGSKTKTNGQHAVATVVCYAANSFLLVGNLTT